MIIVTGAAGFIGSHVALHFAKSDEELVLVDKKELFDDRPYLQKLKEKKNVHFINALPDFLDELSLLVTPSTNSLSKSSLSKSSSLRCVIHLGAITDTAEKNWNALLKWNVHYTKSLWDFCTENQIPLIYASSAATYGGGEHGFNDTHETVSKLKPLNLYGQSKHDFDLIALQGQTEKKTPPLWYGLKFFNVYGPHENHKGAMASAIWHGYNQIRSTGEMTLFKSHNPQYQDGEQSRDFIYVGDILKVMDFLLEKKPQNGIYNLGTGRAETFLELAHSLFGTLAKIQNTKLWPKIKWVETPEQYRAAYQYRTEADMNKLRKAGFTQDFTSLREGIEAYLKEL